MSLHENTVRAIVFDIRQLELKNTLVISAIQALYETTLLAQASHIQSFSCLSLIVLGAKGYDILIDMQPLDNFDQSIQRAFGKLKQLANFPSSSTIYSCSGSMELILTNVVAQFTKQIGFTSMQLEIVVVSAAERDKIKRELETFLYMNECMQLAPLTLIHVPPQTDVAADHQKEQSYLRGKLVWLVPGDEKEIGILFKSWLAQMRKDWKLEMRDAEGLCDWVVRIDIHDSIIDIGQTKNNVQQLPMARRTLEIVEWVRSDGVPNWLIYGISRRLLPTESIAHDEVAGPINKEQFGSLSNWLKQENFVGIARLLPCDKTIEYFILIPGSDGELLMRNIASREMMLPTSSVRLPVCEDGLDISTPKEYYHEKIHSACLLLPHLDCLSQEQFSVIKSIEHKMIMDSAMVSPSNPSGPSFLRPNQPAARRPRK